MKLVEKPENTLWWPNWHGRAPNVVAYAKPSQFLAHAQSTERKHVRLGARVCAMEGYKK